MLDERLDERAEALADHLYHPRARGCTPADAFTGAAGGTACGDLVRISLAIDPRDARGTIVDAGFDAHGCGAAIAAGSAAVALVRGAAALDAARVGATRIAAELGGLAPAKHHAAELAADALHRALGAATRTRARLPASPRRMLVAMSGGVDSAVAALLRREAGDEVVAVTLELWADAENDGEQSCCSAQAVRTARAVAHGLGLPHFSIDLRAEFRAGVVAPWMDGHERGLTPNPCIRCNGNVRLDAMLELAGRLGARALATGHYARVEAAREPGAEPLLRMAADAAKDQSYALAALAPRSLARLRFPLGGLRKAQVREIARDAGLPVAGKRDSQDLCFLAGTSRARFFARHAKAPPRAGPIVDRAGAKLGSHLGHERYTVGQRHGLGLGGGGPYFVLGTDASANAVIVGAREELLTELVPIEAVRLRRDATAVDAVKLRSRGASLPCRLRVGDTPRDGAHPHAGIADAHNDGADAREDGRPPRIAGPGRYARMIVVLAAPAERTAPGQLACLYAGELVVGYGTVARVRARGRPRRSRPGALAAQAARAPKISARDFGRDP